MKLTKKDKQQIKQWVNALRSGKYKQSIGSLENQHGFCCLGVACKELIPTTEQKLIDDYLVGYVPDYQPKAPAWLKNIAFDFYGKTGFHFETLNDHSDFTFEEISDLIEAVYLLNVLD